MTIPLHRRPFRKALGVLSKRRLWLLPVLACGCARHVTLHVPEADAPAEERVAAYERLSPRSMLVRHVTTYHKNYATSYSEVDYLKLGDGTRIRHVGDLLPAVEPNSTTAQAIDESKSNASTSQWLLYTGLGAIVGGFALIVNDLATHGSNGRGVPFYLGAGIGIGGIVELPFAVFYSAKSSMARAKAMKEYPNDLLQRLDLCAGEQGAAPCP